MKFIVSTLQNQSLQSTNNSNRAQNANANENKSVDNNENCEAYKRGYMRQYMKKRRADEKEKRIETKRNAKNSEHMMEINKTVVRKSKADNSEHVREINKKAVRKRKAENPEHIREINKKTVRKCKADNPEYIREINKKAVRKHKADNPEHIREINKKAVRKRKAENPKHIREINKKTVRKRKASNPQQIKDRNRNSPKRLTTVTNLNTTSTTSRLIETPCYGLPRSSPLISSSAKLEQQITKCNAISMIHLFHKNIASGPEYICTCCDQLWYRCSVVKCDANKYKTCSPEIVESCLTGFKSVDNTDWICITCDSNLKKGKLPGCSKANKMGFPHKPDVLNLTSLEERLISPRIPFMQIRELPRGGQLSIHGNIVNVPSDVNSTVHCLPRLISESQTIPIKLKRRLSYKHNYQFQNVRPKKVLDAAKYLVNTSDLFKSEGIQVQNAWIDNINSQSTEQWTEFVQNPDVSSADVQSNRIVTNCTNNISTADVDSEQDDVDGWCEVDERPSGVTDTLLQEPDVNENADKILSFAPGEGNRPLGIFMDKDSEFLSFPTIFCGERRPDNSKRKVPVSYVQLPSGS